MEKTDGKGKYVTRQRGELLAYLETMRGVHVTVQDAYGHFRLCGRPIGLTTLYRQFERLVDEGVVRKYIIDKNSPACFEYAGVRSGCHGPMCFHCLCERCGRLEHLKCEELEGISAHLAARHGFAVNPTRTVFYGLCADCRGRTGRKRSRPR